MNKLALQINLATQPFQRERPVLVASLVLAAVLVALLGLQWSLIRAEQGEGSELRRSIAQLEQQLAEVRQQEAGLRNRIAGQDNETLLWRNRFFNLLIRRKAISWTRLFSDLEQVLPYNVKLVQIRPQLASNAEVFLEMVVAARSPEPVIEMLRALEASSRFQRAQVLASVPPSDTEPLYRYRVSVQYAAEHQP